MNNKTVVLLDGGMGQELIRRCTAGATPLWSAQVMLDQPDIVRDLHIDFIQAGARVITLNSYSATPERLAQNGDASMFEKIQGLAIRVAHEARDMARVEGVKIAGCLPPLVASYRPELSPDYAVSLETYRQIVDVQAPHVDYFMAETIASVKDTRACATAAKESGKPVWFGLTVADDCSGNLRSGEPLDSALTVLNDIGVSATLINCSQPESISACWETLLQHNGPIGAYANAFTSIDKLNPGGTVDVLQARSDLNPEQYAQVAVDWVEQGAAIVGGCCEVGPEHISVLAARLRDKGYSLSGELPDT